MKTSVPNALIHDPRLGADLRLETSSGAVGFSSLAHRFYVIQGERIPWRAVADLIDEAFSATLSSSFVFYRPWAPRRHRKSKHFEQVLGSNTFNFEDINFVVRQARMPTGDILALRSDLGAANSGVWLIGKSSQEDALASCLREANMSADDMVFLAAEGAPYINAALALDESERGTFLLRLTDATAPYADQLEAAIRSLAEVSGT